MSVREAIWNNKQHLGMHANHEVWDTIYLNIKSIKLINLLAYEQELSNDASLVILP